MLLAIALGILSLISCAMASVGEQLPIIDPGSSGRESLASANGPTLEDLLTIELSSSIFYSYARETEFSARFADTESNSTLLVPTNKAVMALARKPHQGPAPGQLEDGMVITEQEFEAQSKRNVANWIGAHIIPVCSIYSDLDVSHPLLEDSPVILSGVYSTLLADKPVTFESKTSESEWSNVKVNGNANIVARKEVRRLVPSR
jgi:hypothetical protein